MPGGKLLFRLFFVVGATCLAGCAAKVVTPVHMAQPGDETLSCEDLKQQTDANRAAAADFLRRDKQVEGDNTTKNVAGAAVGAAIPGLGLLLIASTDLSNAEQVQARALIDRDEQLTYLSKQKGCKEEGKQEK